MNALLETVKAAGQDFEWYPTTDAMIAAVARRLPKDFQSLLDIGAGDGRVLLALAKRAEHAPELYSIEKSPLLTQAQPESITPVGVDFWDQNLTALPVDYIFCNPPYSDFEAWAAHIVINAFAWKAYLVLPRRWKESDVIKDALKRRGATAKVIHEDTFENAERQARAIIDIIEVTFKGDRWDRSPEDPFDVWFEQNISNFDTERELDEDESAGVNLAKVRGLRSIPELVEAFNEDYARMEDNYRKIFTLDAALLKELSVSKEAVRAGIKKRIAGLKGQYWQLLFEKLDAITSRLSTKTKRHFLERLTGLTSDSGEERRGERKLSVAFTASNAYTIVIWAIRHANRYFDEQLVTLYKDLSTFDGVTNYKSNLKTWVQDRWRYNGEPDPNSHYALDYRIVLKKNYRAIYKDESGYGSGRHDYPGGLHTNCHETLDDITAVMGNLGFVLDPHQVRSRQRLWFSNKWQDFYQTDGELLFQAKAFVNGNLHFRFSQKAMRALNVEAGRLLGWLKEPADVVNELGYSAEDARAFFGSNRQLTASSVRLLAAADAAEVR